MGAIRYSSLRRTLTRPGLRARSPSVAQAHCLDLYFSCFPFDPHPRYSGPLRCIPRLKPLFMPSPSDMNLGIGRTCYRRFSLTAPPAFRQELILHSSRTLRLTPITDHTHKPTIVSLKFRCIISLSSLWIGLAALRSPRRLEERGRPAGFGVHSVYPFGRDTTGLGDAIP